MIYLDNNATTATAPEVVEAMMPWWRESYGNPSAGYRFGRRAREAVDAAREQVAALIGALPEEIVFTSGGTESNNTALASALAASPENRRLLTTAVEHSSIHELALYYEETGYDVTLNPVDRDGSIELAAWEKSLSENHPAVAAAIWANNETGAVSPVATLSALASVARVPLHLDAVQAAGKIPMDVGRLDISSLSLSAHKIHGPKGVGALYLNRYRRYSPLIRGGGQESDRRSGTENVPGIVGFGVAAGLALARLDEGVGIATLRDRFEQEILSAVPGVEINADPANRLPNTSNLYFPGVDGEGLLILLDDLGVCCSPGSACSTGSVQPSRVLKAMGHATARARGSVRFSFSRDNTTEDVVEAVAAVRKAVGKLRVIMPSGGGVGGA